MIADKLLDYFQYKVFFFYNFKVMEKQKLNFNFTATVWGLSAGLGITAGAHRLWAHRSYSAKLPLRIFLAILFCMAGMVRIMNRFKDFSLLITVRFM